MADELAARFGEKLQAITLVPSHGGIFEVSLGQEVLFRKGDLGRFPQEGEAGELIAAALG